MGVSDGDYAFDNDLNSVLDALKGTFVESGGVVSEHGTPQMKVVMAVVVYYINGARVSKAQTEVVITAADGSQPRKDIIVGDSAGNITAVAGTKQSAQPSGSTGPQTYQPKPPDIPANKVLLAEVWVEVSEATILDADITDRRVFNTTTRKFLVIGPPHPFLGAAMSDWDNHLSVELSAINHEAIFGFVLPDDFNSFISADMYYFSQLVGNWDYTITMWAGGPGEDDQTHTDSITANGVAVGFGIVNALDILAALDGLSANDLVGVEVTMDALSGTSGIQIAQLVIEYR